ncbi:MAG: DUF3459 domain-containing protein [Opitutaceae bacterium]|jgi:cyclomaltodextrinase|nr:DUF3459 domain-containing protein [Opitutaceae bacterium]
MRRLRTLLPALLLACTLATRLTAAGTAIPDLSAQKARPPSDWLRQAVVYEAFPRAFSATGDFAGLTARLGELRELGVDVVWLMPIHPIGKKLRKGSIGSPYAVRDYYGIHPNYGGPKDLRALVTTAHRLGMKVILDVVLNHSAWDNPLIARHPEYYKRDASGQIVPPVADWTDVAGFNYASPGLRTYMITMLKHWVTEYGIDGYRCDVAGMVPVDFWNEARAALEKVKPDILMLAEASQPDLLLNAFDFDYAWPFHGALNDVLLQGKPATALQRSWEETRAKFPKGSVHLRISDNHDEARAVARFGIRGALAASVLMFTLDGVPLLYNGMEVGDATESGAPALFEPLPIFWQPKERPPLRELYRELIRVRKAHPAFQTNQVEWLANSRSDDVVSFRRVDAKDDFLVVINFSSRPVPVRVTVAPGAPYRALSFPGMGEPTSSDPTDLKLGTYEWRIFHRANAR